MRRKEQVGWIALTVLSLAAFSFFAGLGLRGLFDRLTRSEQGATSLFDYPRVASADTRRIVDPGLKPASTYWEVLKKLQLYYVEELPSETKLAFGSVEAMLASLNDPNTRILTRTEVDALRAASRGEFTGIGAVLTIERYDTRGAADLEEAAGEPPPMPQRPRPGSPAPSSQPAGVRTITVVSVAPGGPADKAGLRPGDRITELDGRWIAPMHVSYRLLTQLTEDLGPQDHRPINPMDLPETQPPDPAREKARKEAEEARSRWRTATELPLVLPMLLGGDKGEHELLVERGQPAQKLKVKVALGTTRVELFSSRKLNASTGYIRLLALNEGTRKQAADALTGFQQAGARNLVLDLRGSAGGSIEAARQLAGMLMGPGKFAELKQRGADGKPAVRPLATVAAAAPAKPAAVTVLVDGGTAGSSELLAAALREQRGARLVGTTTFGDGTEQEVVVMENGVGISITRAQLLTSKGVAFDRTGLKADVAPQGDPIEAALRALTPAAPRRAS